MSDEKLCSPQIGNPANHRAFWIPDELGEMTNTGARVLRQHWECACGESGQNLGDYQLHAPELIGSSPLPYRKRPYKAEKPEKEPAAIQALRRLTDGARAFQSAFSDPIDSAERAWLAGIITGLLLKETTVVFVQADAATGSVHIETPSGRKWILRIDQEH